MRSHVGLIGARVVAVLAGLAVLAGCTTTSGGTPERESVQSAKSPDVSSSGRLDYACALAIDAKRHGPVEGWNITVGGDADPAVHEIAGATGLVGALTGSQLKGHQKLSEATTGYYIGMANLDIPRIQRSLDEMASICGDRGLPAHQPDVSAAGQIDYACALATDVADHRGSAVEWFAIGDQAGPAVYEIGGAVGLLGAGTQSHLDGHEALSDAAADIFEGMIRIQTSAIEKGLDRLVSGCAER